MIIFSDLNMTSWRLFFFYLCNTNCFKFLILWVVDLFKILNGTFYPKDRDIKEQHYNMTLHRYTIFRKSFEEHEVMTDILQAIPRYQLLF